MHSGNTVGLASHREVTPLLGSWPPGASGRGRRAPGGSECAAVGSVCAPGGSVHAGAVHVRVAVVRALGRWLGGGGGPLSSFRRSRSLPGAAAPGTASIASTWSAEAHAHHLATPTWSAFATSNPPNSSELPQHGVQKQHRTPKTPTWSAKDDVERRRPHSTLSFTLQVIFRTPRCGEAAGGEGEAAGGKGEDAGGKGEAAGGKGEAAGGKVEAAGGEKSGAEHVCTAPRGRECPTLKTCGTGAAVATAQSTIVPRRMRD